MRKTPKKVMDLKLGYQFNDLKIIQRDASKYWAKNVA